MDELLSILKNRRKEELRKYILDRVDFNYTFTEKRFSTRIDKFKRIKRDIFILESSLKIPREKSLLFEILPNLLDHHNQVRDYYKWKCQICHINLIDNKDLLDTHIKRWRNLLTDRNILVCCRLCHYNISPRNHKNLEITPSIENRILDLRKNINL